MQEAGGAAAGCGMTWATLAGFGHRTGPHRHIYDPGCDYSADDERRYNFPIHLEPPKPLNATGVIFVS